MDADAQRLDQVVPTPVREVCAALAAAGHQAVCVGGAVRDALLGRPPGDWDVATSALPDQVVGLFRRTIPTGIQHGTVTVMVGKGDARQGVEVTTFRGEGAYSDARRPDEVRFGVALDEDLARRDFVVNAIAWDPIGGAIIDPFGGRDDLAARRLRAVGEPAARFAEDGLRIVRAVRFVAQLDFDLDPATEAAIAGALPSLARVSRERVRVELVKLLAGPAARRALEIAARTGILGQVLPEAVDLERAIARVPAGGGDAIARVALVLVELSPEIVDKALRRLTFSNADRQQAIDIVRGIQRLQAGPPSPANSRRAAVHLRKIPPRRLSDALVPQELQDIIARDPLTTAQLALRGPQVMAALGIAAGPEVGRALEFLLERVLDEPSRNTEAELLRLLRDEFSS